MNDRPGIFGLIWVLSLLALFPLTAVAQGCASCYTTTAAGGTQTVHALRSGILLLFIPPVAIFGAIVITMKKWKPRDFEKGIDNEHDCAN